jgi:hypothetical protein
MKSSSSSTVKRESITSVFKAGRSSSIEKRVGSGRVKRSGRERSS